MVNKICNQSLNDGRIFHFKIYFKQNNISFQNCMRKQVEHHPEIILIYYNYKGLAQVIRLLLCYLEIPFVDIFLEEYEAQKPKLPEKVKQILSSNPIHRDQLPAIIHDGTVIYDVIQIMTYISRVFDREDLLGKTAEQKALVLEILQIYSQKFGANIRFLTTFAAETVERGLEGIELLQFVEGKYLQFLGEAGYIKEIGTYLLKQEQQQFIFGNITIMDFFFVEATRHASSVFSCIDYLSASQRWTEVAKLYLEHKQSKGKTVEQVEILRAMKRYREFFYSRQFYLRNQEYIEGFKMFSGPTSEAMKVIMAGIQKLWAIDRKHWNY